VLLGLWACVSRHTEKVMLKMNISMLELTQGRASQGRRCQTDRLPTRLAQTPCVRFAPANREWRLLGLRRARLDGIGASPRLVLSSLGRRVSWTVWRATLPRACPQYTITRQADSW